MGLIITWLLNAVALWLTALLGIGISFNPMTVGSVLIAALVFGLVNAIIRPILVFLSIPITFLTLGLFLLVINAVVLYIVASFTALEVRGFWGALLGSVVLSIISALLSWAFVRR
jgi:putative membrane protein